MIFLRHLSILTLPAALVVACSSNDASLGGSDSGMGDGGGTVDASGEGGARSDGGAQADGGSIDTGADSLVDASGVTDSSPASDAAPIDASDDVTITDAGDCNALLNGGPAVPETNVAGTLPTPTGGVLPHPAIWYLTKWENYQTPVGPTGNTRKTAFQFGASVYYKATADNGGGDEHDTRTWSMQGVTLVSNQVCPTVDNLTSEYSFSGSTLVLFAGQTVLTFTKQ
jgi:hypothetical protein